MHELRCSYNYAKVLANNLAKKKWIILLNRGVYLIVPLSAGSKPHYTEHEFVIASHLVSPYYIGYWSALNFHKFTEQTPLQVFVATTKRIKNKEILSTKYNFITVRRKKFFGSASFTIGAHKVRITDPEKTIADALDHPEYCGGIGEVAKSLWNGRENLSFYNVVMCADRMENSAIVKRLGYLVEWLNLPVDKGTLSRMNHLLSPGISPLDPTAPRRGSYLTKWNLLVNVPKRTLDEWRLGF